MKTELIWGDKKLVMESLLRNFKGEIHLNKFWRPVCCDK